MKIKKFTKSSIIFDNNKTLTYKIDNPLKVDLYDYILDFISLPKEFYDYEFDEQDLIFSKSILCFYSDNKNETQFTFDEFSSYNYQTIGLLLKIKTIKLIEYDYLGEKMQWPGKEVVRKEIYVPFYKKKRSLTNDQMKVLEEQIIELEKTSDKYSNTNYILEEKIAGEVNIQIYYNNENVLNFNGNDFIELPGNYIHSEKEINYDESKAFKIKNITEKYIEFSNGKKLTFDYDEFDLCKYNYADFMQIDDIAKDTVFYENELVFEAVVNCGIRFGNRGGNMIFVPCYSNQNGNYSSSVDIYYDNKLVLHLHESEQQYYGIPNF